MQPESVASRVCDTEEMDCVSVDEVLEFAEGRLELARRTLVEQHLDLCVPCRSLLVEVARGSDPAPKASRYGRYEIEGPIGAGAMGVVYAARDPQLQRRVALKLLRPGSALGASAAELRALALREARAMAALSHPNVLTVHEAGEEGEHLFVAMELVEGGTLKEWLRARPRALTEVVDVFVQAGRGLAAAHAAGMVHRDFKPDNVLIGKDGRVRVTDFGFAVRASSGAAASGSPGYMAPEQMRGEAPDARADIFSFCVALYEALVGELPFAGQTLDELQHSIEVGPRWGERASRLPARLREALGRGLRSDRALRFPSMQALLDELTDSHRAHARRRVRRLWVAVAAGLLLLAGGISIVSRLQPPRLRRMRQLSRTPYEKPSGIFTDGRRLYFSQSVGGVISPVSLAVSGEGEPVPIATTLADSIVAGVSPDGLLLLLAQVLRGDDSSPLWIQATAGGPARRLGDARLCGAAVEGAAWSPDGGKLAYIFRDELRVIDVDGTHDHVIARLNAVSFWPRWSPDGRHIRFTTGLAVGGIWEVSADGGDPRPVDTAGNVCCGNWTPDGRTFFFVAQQEGGSSINDIWAIRDGIWPALSAPARLTSGPLDLKRPVSSSDGATIFALGYQRLGELVRWSESTRRFEPYLGGISADMLAWSRDGAFIAYVRFPDGTLWRSRADGTDRVQLTKPPVHAVLPAWSPDGKWIAFSAAGASAKDWKTFVLPADGGAARPIGGGDEVELGPSWSPDGASILVSGFPILHESSVRLVDLSSGAEHIVPGSAGLCCSNWTVDGAAIYAIGENPHRLMRYDTKQRVWQEIYRGRFSVYDVTADGRWLYFDNASEKDPAIYRIAADGGNPERVAALIGIPRVDELASGGAWFRVDPDGSPLLLRDVGSQQLFALDLSY